MQNTESIIKQAYQVQGSARARQITFQYEPIKDTLVLIVMERVNSSKKQERWIIQQIAGPWGNTSRVNGLNGTNLDELEAAQQEARNLQRYLENDEGFKDYWKAQVI